MRDLGRCAVGLGVVRETVSLQTTLSSFLMVKGRQVIQRCGEASTGSKTVLICFSLRMEEKHFLPRTGTSRRGRGERRKDRRNERQWNQAGSGGQDPEVALAHETDVENVGCEHSYIL